MIVYCWEISNMNSRCSIITRKFNSTMSAVQMNIEFVIKSVDKSNGTEHFDYESSVCNTVFALKTKQKKKTSELSVLQTL